MIATFAEVDSMAPNSTLVLADARTALHYPGRRRAAMRAPSAYKSRNSAGDTRRSRATMATARLNSRDSNRPILAERRVSSQWLGADYESGFKNRAVSSCLQGAAYRIKGNVHIDPRQWSQNASYSGSKPPDPAIRMSDSRDFSRRA